MTTGLRIKEARKQAGLTQAALGKELGVSGAMIAQYETGKRNPKLETIQRIAGVLHIPVDYFFPSSEVPADKYQWASDIELKLDHAGFPADGYPDGSRIWLTFPDGTLDVTFEQLEQLNERSDAYLRFLILELRQNNPSNFTPCNNGTLPLSDDK